MGSTRLARALCAALAATAVMPAVASAATDVWSATATQKVFPDTTRAADSPSGVDLAAGRDEYEGAQVVIRSDDTLTVTPRITDLAGNNVWRVVGHAVYTLDSSETIGYFSSRMADQLYT